MSTIDGWRNGVPRDFYLDVQRGLIPGHTMAHKFGRNDGVPNGTFEKISLLSIPTSFAAAPSTMRVQAGGNAADTAAGAGAREVTIQGIDTNLAIVTEAVATAGALASASTTASFWRVFRAWVSSVGTYGASNTGQIVIEDSAGPTDTLVIGLGEAQSQYGGYTIPTGKTGWIVSALINVDSSRAADIKLYARENFNDVTAPMSAVRLRAFWEGVIGSLSFHPVSPSGPFSALTDIWWEASAGPGGSEVSVDFELLLIDN